MRREIYHAEKRVQLLDPVTLTSSQNSDILDTAGFEALNLSVLIGQSGDTLSGSVKWDYKVQHGDQSDLSDAADVSADDLIGAFTTVDDAAEDETQQSVGYIGGKRYVRVVITATGTHTNGTPHAVLATLGHAIHQPATS